MRRLYFTDEEWSPRHLGMFAELLVPKHHWRFRTYYLDSYPYYNLANPEASGERKKRKDRELQDIELLERFQVICGTCKEVRKTGFLDFASLPANVPKEPFKTKMVTLYKPEQKQTDVLIASMITKIAYSRDATHITLVAGDEDFVPAVRIAKESGAIIRLLCVNAKGTKTSDELRRVADERKDASEVFTALRGRLSETAVS